MQINESNIGRIAICFILIAGTLILLGFNPTSSLWLDETITAWTIDRPLEDVAHLVYKFQGQSPLYYWCAWISIQIFGTSEIAFRLLSIIAGIVSLILLFKISRFYFSKNASLVVITFALIHGDFIRAWVSARPYSLALCTSLAAIYFFLKWIKSKEKISIVLSALLLITSYYFHYLFLLTGIPLMLLLVLNIKEVNRREWGLLCILAIVSAILLLPGFSHLQSLSSKAHDYSFAPAVSIKNLLLLSFVPEVFVLLFLSLFVVRIIEPFKIRITQNSQLNLLLILILWAFLPGFTLYCHGYLTGNSLLVGRYFLISCAGLLLAVGWLVDKMDISSAQLKLILLAALLIILLPRRWFLEDWRAVQQVIKASDQNQTSAVLLYSGLIEAQHPKWLFQDEFKEYLTVPLVHYPVQMPVYPVPSNLDRDRLNYFESKILPQIKTVDEVYIVAIRSKEEAINNLDPGMLVIYKPQLESIGLRNAATLISDLITVVKFTR